MPSASTAPSSTALPSPSPSLSSPSPATPKLRRILIANRGEIAMRVIHACHDTGRIAIAAYADPDADALFVHAADEAYALGGSDAQSTYLNIAAIVETAHKAHVDAVHPGYGFLAENAEFAQAVIDAGMTWIGPQPATIRALGSKVEARRIAAEVGAPMAPGTTEPVHDPAEVITFAKEHGLPLAIKAVYGGGGRGLKVVHRLEDVREAFVSATHEAELAFGNGDCFIERFLARPRHVEVQILGDGAGNVVAVGTRDCSLQRRNQKLIEEAPAPFLPPETTRALEDAAVAICSRAHYESAGTVEFLVDPDGTMSFMEVNTRIQVEHPVTEEVTGVDLVAAQLAIAEGAHVTDIPGLEHGTPVPHGHAIEFRINAEDPSLGFVPFPGIVERLNVPTGPGIRFDSGVAQGGAIPGQFDSMIAKLIVSAPSRSACLTRARHALDELAIAGVQRSANSTGPCSNSQLSWRRTAISASTRAGSKRNSCLPWTCARWPMANRVAGPQRPNRWKAGSRSMANACDWACPLRSPPSPRWARGWPDWLEPAQRGTLPSRPILANRSSKPC